MLTRRGFIGAGGSAIGCWLATHPELAAAQPGLAAFPQSYDRARRGGSMGNLTGSAAIPEIFVRLVIDVPAALLEIFVAVVERVSDALLRAAPKDYFDFQMARAADDMERALSAARADAAGDHDLTRALGRGVGADIARLNAGLHSGGGDLREIRLFMREARTVLLDLSEREALRSARLEALYTNLSTLFSRRDSVQIAQLKNEIHQLRADKKELRRRVAHLQNVIRTLT